MNYISHSDPALFDLQAKLTGARQFAVDVARQALAHEQQRGFPKDRKDYRSFLTVRGRKRPRDIATLTADEIVIGSRGTPTSISVEALGSWEYVLEAAREAYAMLIRRAPVRTGRYRRSIVAAVNLQQVRLDALRSDGLNERDRLMLTAPLEYAGTVEAWAEVFWATARAIEAKYPDLNIAFVWRTSSEVAYRRKRDGQRVQPNFPAIVMAPSGTIVASKAGTRPGRNKRRRSRRRRARSRLN